MALNENRLDVAERLLKPHLKEDPLRSLAAIRMLAELAARIGRLQRCGDAASPGGRARARLGRRPRPIWRWSWAEWAGQRRRMALLDEIFAAEPDEIGHWNLKAATLGRLGDFDEAIRLYEAGAGARRPSSRGSG